ncbi:MAG: glycosyltransferase family 39 protein [Fibrella sp.]|nr:glycosyltransferase family 39 protein [Armatimonadota bacterium]
MPKMTSKKSISDASQDNPLTKYVPLLLVILALALRLWGITWALPEKTRFYSYHVDESVVVGHALDLNPLAGQVDPNFYNYGSLTLLLDGLVIHAGRAAGLIDANAVDVRPGGLALPTGTELLTARLISALLGAGTVGFLYGTGRLLYGQTTGIVAGIGYAIAPLAVQHAHFATVDVGGVFWIAGSLYFAAKFWCAGSPPAKFLFLAGLFAGLAAAAKYNGGLVMLAGIVAWWVAMPRKPLSLGLLFAGTGLGFLVGCPGIVMNPSAVIRDVLFEAQHVASGHGAVFTDTLPGFLYHIVVNLRWGLTVPLLVVCLVSVGVAVARRRPADAILAAFAIPYYLLIGLAAVKFSRYTLPLFPPLFLLAGAAWSGWRNARSQTAFRAFAVCGGISALGFSIALDQTMTRPDPRDEAAAYIRSLPTVRTVGFPAGPWNYSPTLNPSLTHPYPPVALQVALQNEPTRLIPSVRFDTDGQPERDERGFLFPTEWSLPLLAEPFAPDALAFGELHYDDWLRTRFAPAQEYLRVAEKQYPNRKDFTNPITLFGLPVAPIYTVPGEPWFGLPRQPLPHDMLYTNSSVSVWTR